MAVMRALILFLVFSVESASGATRAAVAVSTEDFAGKVEENCPYGWTHFGMKCYKFFSQSVNWTTAEKNCQSVDANLASVHNTDEHNFLLSLVPATTSAWVGGHDGEIDGQWLWSDASQFNFTSWCSGEPNNYQGNPENCLQINFTNNSCWNDGQCSSEMSYICAKPLRSC